MPGPCGQALMLAVDKRTIQAEEYYRNMMKILLQLLLTACAISFKPVTSSLIDWNANRKLTWDDFRAKPDKNSPNAALTGTNIRFDFSYNSSQGFQYHITCQFDKNKSWGRVKNDYILLHEQGHFDIAEIYARRLCKAFREYHPNVQSAKNEVATIYEKTMDKLSKAQKQYDLETGFSINKEKQIEWQRKIEGELKSLQAYADYH
ncbi:MAG: DUF922 domain-containing protein [Bacteroidetes bacterium]|nr:DUF922 domain-containing protein [Bacteroidota bacterium]MBS1973171.1 DUF922 domain-containing protein [Bacteroidota bacterium]